MDYHFIKPLTITIMASKYEKLIDHLTTVSGIKNLSDFRSNWKPIRAVLETDFTCPCGQRHVTNTVDIANHDRSQIVRIGIDCCENLYGYTLTDQRHRLNQLIYKKRKLKNEANVNVKEPLNLIRDKIKRNRDLLDTNQLKQVKSVLTDRQYYKYLEIFNEKQYSKDFNIWESEFLSSIHERILKNI